MAKSTSKKRKNSIKRVKKKLTAVKKAVLGKVRKKSPPKPFISNKLEQVKKLGTVILQQTRQVISAPFSDKKQPENAPSPASLPWRYNETRAVLLVRDPWWVFAYWDVQDEHETRVRADVLRARDEVEKKVLRVYDVGEQTFFDIEPGIALNWYIDLGKPARECFFEIGLRTQAGRFFPLVRSNTVKTPRYGFSDVIDEEWMLPEDDYWKLFGAWMDASGRPSSYDIQEFIKKFIQNISSRGSVPLVSSGATITKKHTEVSIKVRKRKSN